MTIDIAAVSHVGRVRKNNEDAYLISRLNGEEPLVNAPLRNSHALADGLLAAVADGMGGAAAGEIASREGLACIAMYLFGHWARFPGAQDSESDLLKALRGAILEASDAVIRYAYEDRASRGMGSTLTAAVLWRRFAYFAQVGDSRAYLFRNRTLTQVTEDQTLVNSMVAAGTLTAEEARTHPQRNMITQALGAPRPLVTAISRLTLARGDRLLLCSDGLHGEVTDAEIAAECAKYGESRAVVEALLGKALAHGAKDNVTLVMLDLDEPSLPEPAGSGRIELIPLPEGYEAPPKGFLSRIGRMLVGRS